MCGDWDGWDRGTTTSLGPTMAALINTTDADDADELVQFCIQRLSIL